MIRRILADLDAEPPSVRDSLAALGFVLVFLFVFLAMSGMEYRG